MPHGHVADGGLDLAHQRHRRGPDLVGDFLVDKVEAELRQAALVAVKIDHAVELAPECDGAPGTQVRPLPVLLRDEHPVREDRIVVEHPEIDQQPKRIADDVRGIREDGLLDGSIIRGHWFSGGLGPLPGPDVRLPGERILIDPLVGALLGHALHDGPQQRELVRCVLAVPGQQGGHYSRIETCHKEQGNKTPQRVIFPCVRCGKVLLCMK